MVRQRRGRRRSRIVLLPGLLSMAGCLGLLAGCRSTPPPNPHDPHVRLAAFLEQWSQVREDGSSCDERRPGKTPLIDCERTRKGLERLSIEFPYDPEVLLANAVVSYESGRVEDAGKELDALRRITPVQPDAALLRARIAIDEGNLRFARRLLDEQIELVPDHASLHELSAAVHYLEQHYDQALRELRLARRLGAPAWRTAYHEGLVAEAREEYPAAARAYRTSLEDNPGFAPARSRLRGLAVRDPAP